MDAAENLRLSQQLCFALYAATHAIIRSYRGMLGELGLTYPQYLVLVTLMEHPSMTSGALARALKLDAGTLTPLLKRLAAAGLVLRERRQEDERVVDVSLTAEGWALHDALVRTPASRRLPDRPDAGGHGGAAHQPARPGRHAGLPRPGTSPKPSERLRLPPPRFASIWERP